MNQFRWRLKLTGWVILKILIILLTLTTFTFWWWLFTGDWLIEVVNDEIEWIQDYKIK